MSKLSIWAEHAVLNISSIKTLSHPDTFFEQDPIDPTEPVGKNRKAFFEAKGFKVYKA